MRRHLPRLIVALLLSLIPAALGTLVALLYSPSGTLLLGRLAGRQLSALFRGTFSVDRISGSFVSLVELEGVVIQDSRIVWRVAKGGGRAKSGATVRATSPQAAGTLVEGC